MNINTKNTVINDKFMLWLQKYILINEVAIFKKINGVNEQGNLSKLKNLYEFVEGYAEDNYMEPVIMDYNNVYNKFFNILYNNKVYQIGYYVESSFVYFCRETFQNNVDDVISFENIKDNIPLSTTKVKTEKLKELSKMIQELAKLGIPYNSIAETTNEAFTKCKSKKK